MTEKKVTALPSFETSQMFDDRQLAKLRHTRHFKQSKHAIDRDKVYDDLKKLFSVEKITDLGQVCA